jgi:hypothetical protein
VIASHTDPSGHKQKDEVDLMTRRATNDFTKIVHCLRPASTSTSPGCLGGGRCSCYCDGCNGRQWVQDDLPAAAGPVDERIERSLQRFRIGEQVRTVETIIYGIGEEVPEGTVGHIQQIDVYQCTSLVMVQWEGLPSILYPCSVERLERCEREQAPES